MALVAAATRSMHKVVTSSSRRGIHTVGVVGLGLMGHGIAQVAAMAKADYRVVGVDSTSAAVESGRSRIERSLGAIFAKQAAKGNLAEAEVEPRKAAVLSRLSFATDRSALEDCDLVVEAITEDKRIKLPFYADLGRITKDSCILASNTSSLAIREMAEASGRTDRSVPLFQACR